MPPPPPPLCTTGCRLIDMWGPLPPLRSCLPPPLCAVGRHPLNVWQAAISSTCGGLPPPRRAVGRHLPYVWWAATSSMCSGLPSSLSWWAATSSMSGGPPPQRVVVYHLLGARWVATSSTYGGPPPPLGAMGRHPLYCGGRPPPPPAGLHPRDVGRAPPCLGAVGLSTCQGAASVICSRWAATPASARLLCHLFGGPPPCLQVTGRLLTHVQ